MRRDLYAILLLVLAGCAPSAAPVEALGPADAATTAQCADAVARARAAPQDPAIHSPQVRSISAPSVESHAFVEDLPQHRLRIDLLIGQDGRIVTDSTTTDPMVQGRWQWRSVERDLRTYEFRPATLDGCPVPAHLFVTLGGSGDPTPP